MEIVAGEHQGHYLVLTSKQLIEEHGLARRLQNQLQERPGSPQAVWVRPLTRRLQRLFHWGDVLATQNDVARACKAGDGDELKAIMPQAYRVVERGRYDQLPKLFDALRNSEQLMLTDCSDDARALHDVLGHTWPEEPTKRAECTQCNAFPAFVCSCGAQRCKDCLQEPPAGDPLAPAMSWMQHPDRPLPFYVVDQEKMPDSDKVVWIRQEIGNDAELTAFSVKFLDLFGDRLRGPVPQKSACLKLFGVYSDAAPGWRKECDLPPNVLQQFERIWEPAAPERCLECNKRAAPGTKHPLRRFGRAYCSSKCSDAGAIVVCKRCTPERKCGFCSMKPAPSGERRLDKVLRENEVQLKRAREKMPGHATTEPDPNHDPAWKRRRRS